ncbi:hypothetical protein NIES267_00240 [Calothrix parasitica NIES-267]|uniref:DUF4760 domain-containing protein n=1 Tax=Calothrix parasitica NIES-267 TaxID=1973488 RepID=A0A1Z4LH58_9CYAN|nr:hypothetical protein NIES267_00240 [Calothrix parasitica NIES-267]
MLNKKSQNPDEITTLNISFRFSLKASVVAFIVATPFIFFYSITNNKNHREALSFAATALTTSIAGVSAFYALQSIKQNADAQEIFRLEQEKSQKEARDIEEKDRKIDRTFNYIMRWNDLEYARIKKSVAQIHDEITNGFSTPLEKEDKLKKYLEDNPLKEQDITNILNFLEAMSICIKKEIVNEDLLHEFYRFIVIRYWETFESIVIYRRKKMDNPKIYEGLELLAQKWK